MRKALIMLLVVLLLIFGATTVIAQETTVSTISTCTFDARSLIGSACDAEGYVYIYKGEFHTGQFNLDALVIANQMTGVKYGTIGLNVNDINSPDDDVVGIWVELAPNTDVFWQQFLDSRK